VWATAPSGDHDLFVEETLNHTWPHRYIRMPGIRRDESKTAMSRLNFSMKTLKPMHVVNRCWKTGREVEENVNHTG
jgi:hypothetical protein